jgi:hypothetical protein
MRKLILGALDRVSEIGSFVVVIGGLVVGLSWGGDVFAHIVGGLVGFLAGLIVASVVFGMAFLLLDIEESSRETAKNTLETKQALTSLQDFIKNIDQKVAQLESLKLQERSENAVSDSVSQVLRNKAAL